MEQAAPVDASAGGDGPRSGEDGLLAQLTTLRSALEGLAFPLELDGAGAARAERRALAGQLDDYVLPRLRSIEAPLLAVVGGSTGAGKSTLLNSLVGARVSASGVLRPTTRAPVLVHAPQDAAWFTGPRVLPGLARDTVAPGSPGSPGSLALLPSAAVPAGLALLDAPDIDSVVAENRELAAQLLAAADLWVFVTTAARYADAVPWSFLREASGRSAAVAVVLDRVPPEAQEEVAAHLRGMLAEEGLADAPLFVIAEGDVREGLLADDAAVPVRDWLHGLAGDAAARAAVVRRTLHGALAAYPERVGGLAAALDAQATAAGTLRAAASEPYAAATGRVDAALEDGSLLRGEVLARWQELVGTGELLRQLESRLGRLRDRVVSAVRGRPAPGEELAVALESGVEALVLAEADRAAERAVSAWRVAPGGVGLLAAGGAPELAHASPQLRADAQRTVRAWQGGLLELVRQEGAGRKATARVLSYGVNGAGLVVMVAVFASTGGLTGGELLVAGGTSVVGQKLLEALLGDEAVRRLAAKARADLRGRLDALLAGERERFTRLVDAALPDPEAGERLRTQVGGLARELRGAR
ncbi:dynamin family protein [Motilibacter aurantiacus]|uniref:dynamin family protein n=1 Tax=Motilibacter aurantiacus TaxID=2714955 RepID=UPI001408CD45|nr:dynamin family protein [Motilibacter aurantiacus]NHC45216.1 ABC transporter [Motilibacter aurantiacus]